jgi:hypothetical protein
MVVRWYGLPRFARNDGLGVIARHEAIHVVRWYGLPLIHGLPRWDGLPFTHGLPRFARNDG